MSNSDAVNTGSLFLVLLHEMVPASCHDATMATQPRASLPYKVGRKLLS